MRAGDYGELVLRTLVKGNRENGDWEFVCRRDEIGQVLFAVGVQSGSTYRGIEGFPQELADSGYIKLKRGDRGAVIATLQRDAFRQYRRLWWNDRKVELFEGKPAWVVVLRTIGAIVVAVLIYVAGLLTQHWLGLIK